MAAFAAHVGGVGGYAFINDLLYLELTGYRTIDFRYARPNSGRIRLGAGMFRASRRIGA